jgi:hypothetical protein
LPPEADEASLSSGSGGTIDHVPFGFPGGGGEVVDLVFDMSSRIRLSLHDNGVAQSSASCRLFSGEHGYTLTPIRTSDENGQVLFSDLGAGLYELHVEAPGSWPVVKTVEATPAGIDYSVEIRHLGTLDLEFLTAGGHVAVPETIEIEFLPTGESVGIWAAEGRLPNLGGVLAADNSGHLRLQEIPHGEYRWSCSGAVGTVLVEPGQVSTVSVHLP